MNLTRQDRFRLRNYIVNPTEHSIAGPAGTISVRESSMEVLCRLADRPNEFLGAEVLLHAIFPASGEPRGLLRACIEELRTSFDDHGARHSFIEFSEARGYRLLVKPESVTSENDEIADWFDELKRRRVFRVVAGYSVAAWLILQIVDVVSDALPVPDWTLTAATVALAGGFPVAALLAWIFQITPKGIVAEGPVGGAAMDRTRLIHYVDLVIIGVLLVVVAFLSYGHVFPQLQKGEEVRVAVLSFENLSGEDGDSYLSEGIADDIRSRLHDLPQVLVAARSSSRSLSNRGLDIRSIGQRLGVQQILEGTFRRVGDRIRLSVQLVDVESGFNRWDETYDTRVKDVLAVQNRISLIVASELRIVLSDDVREMLAENVTDDPAAFDLYLQARNYLDRPSTVENQDSAASLFERAIALDNEFALGYAGLCETYIDRYRETGDTAFVQPAERNCNRALSLDTRLAEVHTALGNLYMISGDFGAAGRSYNSAIEIDPRAVGARVGLGDALTKQKRLEDAEAQYVLAIELVPANWSGFGRYANFLIRQQRYDEAINNYERALELAPGNANGFNNLGVVYYMLGDFENAAEYFRRSIEIQPDGAPFSNTGTMYYYAGDYEAAAEMYAKAAENTPSDYRLWGNLADAQRYSGVAPEQVGKSYEKAVELANLQLEVNPQDSEALVMLAWYYTNLDREIAARSALEASNVRTISDPAQLYTVGLTYALLGDSASASEFVEKAAALGFPRAMIEATPELTHSPKSDKQ